MAVWLREFLRQRWRCLLRGLAVALLGVALLPPVLVALYAVVPPPVTPLMLIRLIEGETLEKDWRPLAEIDPDLPLSVAASEDSRFCLHSGFDFVELEKAVRDWREGGRARGASTISMQLARNLMLWPGGGLVRKGAEAYVTLWVELLLSKRRILELYLNIVEWAPGAYGAEAAARRHFGTGADSLTRRQAALLAVTLPSPRNYDPSRPSTFLSRQAGTVEARARTLGGELSDCFRVE